MTALTRLWILFANANLFPWLPHAGKKRNEIEGNSVQVSLVDNGDRGVGQGGNPEVTWEMVIYPTVGTEEECESQDDQPEH